MIMLRSTHRKKMREMQDIIDQKNLAAVRMAQEFKNVLADNARLMLEIEKLKKPKSTRKPSPKKK